jgi:hypothetical protein
MDLVLGGPKTYGSGSLLNDKASFLFVYIYYFEILTFVGLLSAGIGSVQLNITQGPRDVLNRWV